MEDILSTLSLGRKLLGMKFWMMELEVAPLDWAIARESTWEGELVWEPRK